MVTWKSIIALALFLFAIFLVCDYFGILVFSFMSPLALLVTELLIIFVALIYLLRIKTAVPKTV